MTRPEPFAARQTTLHAEDGYWVGGFFAMGCPCEVLVETSDKQTASEALRLARNEAWRIEQKWSRYLDASTLQSINSTAGSATEVDAETAGLLDYCKTLFELSNGAFDITSGVLREIWVFDGSDNIPTEQQVEQVMRRVSWNKVYWNSPVIQLKPDMQIDFGGVGKEYAVDLCCARIHAEISVSCLVNFGGDVGVTAAPKNRPGWSVGVESVSNPGSPTKTIPLVHGGLATSGNSHRYLERNGVRYSHILDARTGWPVTDAPQSITVQATTCTEAGMFATLSCLQGANAEAFLNAEGITAWVQHTPPNVAGNGGTESSSPAL
jgi:thiamine biosynthesis lipoprotein